MICCARYGSAAPSVLLRWRVAAAASKRREVWRTVGRLAAWEAARPRRQPVARATRALEVRRVRRVARLLALPAPLDPAGGRDPQDRGQAQRGGRGKAGPGKVAPGKAARDRVGAGAARATEASIPVLSWAAWAPSWDRRITLATTPAHRSRVRMPTNSPRSCAPTTGARRAVSRPSTPTPPCNKRLSRTPTS